VFDEETRAFLESGCALIVATVDDDGEPHAGRLWGLDVLADGPGTVVRVLLDVDDLTTIDHAAARARIAVTATSVRTFHSMQLKGVARHLEAATEADDLRAHRYMDAFFLDIQETDGTPAELLERFEPRGFVACEVEVHDCFDQTPGPAAGARIEQPA
jgi:hypothetical protein